MEFPGIKQRGSFVFRAGDLLRQQSAGIPDGYGIYLIYADSDAGELLYVGKSGTITDGVFKKQGLRERLNRKQDGICRQDYFTDQLKDGKMNQLFVKWYIIDESKVLPAYCEAFVLQWYYSQYCQLPRWNRSF